MRNVYKKIQENKNKGQKMLAVLIDPDKYKISQQNEILRSCLEHQVDFLFVGGSLLLKDQLEACILSLKSQDQIPVILFPGNGFQISSSADAILFTSLLSGRNPEYLIGQQIQAAPLIKEAKLESISTAYLLIESGGSTSVSYISNTLPIPAHKTDIALATALAAELMGMKMIYLEAGSGAKTPVSKEMIQALHKAIALPLIAGGGIRDAFSAEEKYLAGADILVIGNGVEQETNLIQQIAQVRNQINTAV